MPDRAARRTRAGTGPGASADAGAACLDDADTARPDAAAARAAAFESVARVAVEVHPVSAAAPSRAAWVGRPWAAALRVDRDERRPRTRLTGSGGCDGRPHARRPEGDAARGAGFATALGVSVLAMAASATSDAALRCAAEASAERPARRGRLDVWRLRCCGDWRWWRGRDRFYRRRRFVDSSLDVKRRRRDFFRGAQTRTTSGTGAGSAATSSTSSGRRARRRA